MQGAEVLGADDRRTGQALLEGGEDLDPLDGVDAQVGVHAHLQLQHLHRVAGLLADHRQQGLGDQVGGCRGRCDGRGCGRCRPGCGRCRRGHAADGSRRCSGDLLGRQRRAPLQDVLLLLQQGLDGPGGLFLPFQEAAVQLGGLLLHPLQDRHPFPGHPQGFGQGVPGSRCSGDSGERGPGGCGLQGGPGRRCHGRSLGPRLDIVGAAQRDGHGRLLAGRRQGRLVPLVPFHQLDSMAEDGQLGQAAGQVTDAGVLAAGGVQRHDRVAVLAEDRPDQAAQARAGADLHEGPDAGLVHGLDLGHEFHRPRQLPGQEFPGLGGRGGIFGGGAVGEDRDAAVRHGYVGQGRKERPGCVGHQGTVESGGHRQLLAGQLPAAAGREGPGDLCAGPGQHRLGGGVAVGDNQLETLFFKHPFHVCQGCGNRQHAALVAVSGGHQAAAQAGEGMEGVFIQAAGGTQGGQFTVAVAGGRFWFQAEGFQYPQGAQADGADGRLGHIRGAQGLFLLFPDAGPERGGGVDQVRQACAVRCLEAVICSCKRVEHLGEAAGQVPQHASVLGTLAGKQQADLARGRAAGEICAVGRAPGGVRALAERGPGGGAECRQVGPVVFDHQGQAAGSGGVECRPQFSGPGPQVGPGHVAVDRRQGSL